MGGWWYLILGGVARAALAALTGYLVTHHILTAAQGDSFASEALTHLMLVAPFAGAILWSVLQKYRSRIEFLTALDSPQGTTEARVKAAIAEGWGSSLKTGVPLVLLAFCCTLAWLPACASAPPTKVAAVADIGAKLEASAGALLSQAQTASATVNPATGRTFISRDQLDVVAIAVDKVGRMGLLLEAGLRDYNAAKAAGGDTSSLVIVVQQTVADITSALNVIGKSIPNGTVASIDQAIGSVFSIIAQARVAVSL